MTTTMLDDIEKWSPRITLWYVTQKHILETKDGDEKVVITKKTHFSFPILEARDQCIERIDNVLQYIKWWDDKIKDLKLGKVLNQSEIKILHEELNPEKKIEE